MTDIETADFFRDHAARRGSLPVLGGAAHQVSGDARTAPRRDDGDRLRRGGRGLQRRRDVLVVHLGDRPFPGFPVPLEGDDVSELIEKHRDELPMSDQLITFDPPKHTDHRALLMRLITPKRLKENEEFMWRLADRVLDDFLAGGQGEFIGEFAGPFALLGDRRPARCARRGSRRVRRGARPPRGSRRRQHRQRVDGARPAGVPLRPVLDLHRGSAPRAPRRRAHRPGHRDVPRRLDPRGHRRRAGRDQRVRGGPGDHGPAAEFRAQGARRAPRHPGAAPQRTRPHPELHRGDAADRKPRQGRLPAVARADHASAGSTSRPAPR